LAASTIITAIYLIITRRNLHDASTPVLAAATTCNSKIMDMLLKRGGDLRLHDCRNRGYREYVKLNTNILSRTRVLSRLERKKKKLQKLFGENAEELPLARWENGAQLVLISYMRVIQ